MPSTSAKQHNFMEAVAHNPTFAKKAGVPQNVGQDFSKADKGKTFKQGGVMKESKGMEMRQAKQLEKIAKEEREEAKGMKKGGKAYAMGGSIKEARMEPAKMQKISAGGKLANGEHTIQKKGHTRAMMPKMGGGSTTGMKRGGSARSR
jgi:hypothetical protein